MASTSDCGGGLSREHYISRALLEGLDLRVRGLPWHAGEVAHVSSGDMVAKILCRRHNSALSPLDTAAKTYFLAMEEAFLHSSRRSLSTRNAHFLTSGTGLELWAMKTLAGLYASGIKFRAGDRLFRDFPPPMDRIVAALSSSPARSLMTLVVPMARSDHETTIGRRAVSIGPIVTDEPERLRGLIVRMHGVGLHFLLNDMEASGRDEESIVRPDMIDLHGRERSSRVYLAWSRPRREGRLFELTLGRPTLAREKEFQEARQKALDRLASKRADG